MFSYVMVYVWLVVLLYSAPRHCCNKATAPGENGTRIEYLAHTSSVTGYFWLARPSSLLLS